MSTEISEGLLPVEEFAEKKNLDPEKVIEMVRSGFYEGRKIDDEWFIKEHEINENKNHKHNPNDVLIRIPLGLLLAPGIGLFFAYLITLGVSQFEGARAYAILNYTVLISIIAFAIIIANSNKRIFYILTTLSVLGLVVGSFA